jgi:hypothetical protein
MTADPLAGLRDYHLPEPISWWPPAPGWWLLASLAATTLAALLLWRRRRRLSISSARLATRELARLLAEWQSDRDDAALLSELSRLLRRFVLVRFPGDRAAGLCGESWLRYLADKSGDAGFVDGVGRCLAEAPYRAPGRAGAALDATAVARLVERFVAGQGEGARGRRR